MVNFLRGLSGAPGRFNSYVITVKGNATAGDVLLFVDSALREETGGAVIVNFEVEGSEVPFGVIAELLKLGFNQDGYLDTSPPGKQSLVLKKWNKVDKATGGLTDNKYPPFSTAKEGVTALIFSPDEKEVLLLTEKDRDTSVLCKSCTGSVNVGESAPETALREALEETGHAPLRGLSDLQRLGTYRISGKGSVTDIHSAFSFPAAAKKDFDEVKDVIDDEISSFSWFPVDGLTVAYQDWVKDGNVLTQKNLFEARVLCPDDKGNLGSVSVLTLALMSGEFLEFSDGERLLVPGGGREGLAEDFIASLATSTAATKATTNAVTVTPAAGRTGSVTKP